MIYDITNYGAVCNTDKINTVAIQTAIDDCSNNGGGTVNIPSGVFITGTIYLKANVELHLQTGAELRASLDKADYNDLDAYPENWSSAKEGWEGRHLIIAKNVENVAITGPGKINGAADKIFDGEIKEYRWPQIWSYGLQHQKDLQIPRPGQTVVFIGCKCIKITDITIINSSSWCLFFHGCEDVQVRGYKAFNKCYWANTDGLDIDTCKNVTVSDCIIDTGDDAIAIRCDSTRLNNGSKACENIAITNCVLSSSSSVFRLGVGVGEIHNVLISNIIVPRGGEVFNILTACGSKSCSLIEDITISNIIADNASIPFTIIEDNDAYIKNITISDYRVKCFAGSSIVAHNYRGVSNISIKNMQMSIVPPPFSRSVLKEDSSNNLFYIENAEDVFFDNVKVDFSDGLEKMFKEKFCVCNSKNVIC